MKTFLLVIVIALVAVVGVVKAGSSCRREFTVTIHYTQNLACVQNGMDIQGFTVKIAKGEMTYDEVAAQIASKCETANSASCYDDISTPIVGSCNKIERMQVMRNALKTVFTFNEFMCQNNGQHYLDFVHNDGAACYKNDEKEKCYEDGKNALNLQRTQLLNDDNVCALLDVEWECLHHYNECDNQNVGIFYRQLLELLREKFNC